MPIAAALPAIGSFALAHAPALLSAGTSAYSALKGGSGSTGASPTGAGGTVPTGYMPTGSANADQQYQDLVQHLYGTASALPGQVAGAAQGYVNNIGANPYAGQSMDWAQGLAGLGQQVSQGQQAGSQQAYGYAPGILNSAMGYGNQVMQTAFDPQNQLHDYMSQQSMDRTNALNAMNGVAGTPYGAGLASDASRNMEMDWQNQQLGRQVSGAGAYNSLLSGGINGYGSLMGLGSTLGNQSILSSASTGNVPYQTYMGQQTDALGGLGSLNSLTSGAMGPGSDVLTALGNYLGFGNNATRIGQSGQAQAFSQNQTQGSNLGQTIGGMSGGGGLGGALQSLAGIFGHAPITSPVFSPSFMPNNTDVGGMSNTIPSFNFG